MSTLNVPLKLSGSSSPVGIAYFISVSSSGNWALSFSVNCSLIFSLEYSERVTVSPLETEEPSSLVMVMPVSREFRLVVVCVVSSCASVTPTGMTAPSFSVMVSVSSLVKGARLLSR